MRLKVVVVCALAMCFVGGAGADRTMTGYTRGQLRSIVARTFQRAGAGAVRRAFCIVNRESSWNPQAISVEQRQELAALGGGPLGVLTRP